MAVRCHVKMLIAGQASIISQYKSIKWTVLRFKTCSFIVETKNFVFFPLDQVVLDCVL